MYFSCMAIFGAIRICKYLVDEYIQEPSISLIVLFVTLSLAIGFSFPVWVFRIARYFVSVAERTVPDHVVLAGSTVSESTKAVEPTGTSTAHD